MRRLRLFPIEEHVFILFLDGGLYSCVTPLPKGSKIVGVNYDYMARRFLVAVESEYFDPVPKGQEIPIFEVVVQHHNNYTTGVVATV